MIYPHAGWLRRFMKRKGLSLRWKTTVSQTTPEKCILKLVSFIVRLRALQINHSYPHNSIFAMDVHSILDGYALRHHSSTTVPVKSRGHEKSHFTVILTARANGTKMKPFVAFKGKGTWLVKELEQVPGIVVQFSTNGWMNDVLTIDYLHIIVGTFSFNKRLLVWDAYRYHTSAAVQAKTACLRLHTAIVQGGRTNAVFTWTYVKWVQPWLSVAVSHGSKSLRKCKKL